MKPNNNRGPKPPIWKSKVFWGIIVVVLVVGGGALWYFRMGPGSTTKSPTTSSAPSYHTATVTRGDLKISATGTGTLVANKTADLSFPIAGTVSELDVQLGDQVKAGQVLAKLNGMEDLQAQVANDQVQLLQAQQALETLQQNGSVSLAQAYKDLLTAQDKLTTAQTNSQNSAYARCSKEINTKYAAALDRATQKLNQVGLRDYGTDAWITAKNDYDTAKANYDYCIAYSPAEKTDASASVDVASVALKQAQDKYDALKAASGIDPQQLALDEAKVEQAKSQLAQDQKALDGITMIAPMDGRVVAITSSAGSRVDTSTFMTIADMSQPSVTVNVAQNDLAKLALGNQARIAFDALPDQTFTGKVSQVNPQLTTSGQFPVATATILLDSNSAKGLQNVPLGLNASAEIISQQVKNVILAPIEALKDLGNNQYSVFVVGKDGKLQLKMVQVGLMDSTHAEITSGLNEGDVVTTGTVSTSK